MYGWMDVFPTHLVLEKHDSNGFWPPKKGEVVKQLLVASVKILMFCP